MKYSGAIPYIAVVVVVFLAVSASFVCYGIFDAKNNADTPETTIEDFMQKNIFISVQNSSSNTLDTNFIVSFDPKDASVRGIVIPPDTRINIASSDQMFKDVMNIGGVEMMRVAIEEIVPLNIDYHLIVKSDDFAEYSGDFAGFLRSVFTDALWQQADLNGYLTQILSLASTDLTMMKTPEYAEFLNQFAEHTTEFYTISGVYQSVGERYLYFADRNAVNELINTQILN